jgi:hypothetical protein
MLISSFAAGNGKRNLKIQAAKKWQPYTCGKRLNSTHHPHGEIKLKKESSKKVSN